ncbi:hypothetical protein [Paraburkholderia elongata]|uniref:Uncharacterized protein n=1 Tax=Paraburkholderia elongata TaxID=2675747 RepID=A0A972SLE0_9BURK|nr:hypothetical protein [Paraburkholderia elongata]NPT59037.1 hypothetical protein [Paraburkholderia elongata]
MTDEQIEAHIKSTAWYRVLSEAAKDDDEGASVFRMARMAASEAWQASRRAALEESREAVHAERLVDPTDSADDIAYNVAVQDCENAIRGLVNGDAK